MKIFQNYFDFDLDEGGTEKRALKKKKLILEIIDDNADLKKTSFPQDHHHK